MGFCFHLVNDVLIFCTLKKKKCQGVEVRISTLDDVLDLSFTAAVALHVQIVDDSTTTHLLFVMHLDDFDFHLERQLISRRLS
jgi:hypothetical protein